KNEERKAINLRQPSTESDQAHHRLYDAKREVRVYDYADLNVPMLARMFDRRCRGYEAIGYTILLPASAIPVGLPTSFSPPIPSGSAITQLVCEGLLGTASTRL